MDHSHVSLPATTVSPKTAVERWWWPWPDALIVVVGDFLLLMRMFLARDEFYILLDPNEMYMGTHI
jgi:hypothetical protein